jgi:hypothetical protein
MEVLLKRKNYTTLVKTKFLTIGINILNIYIKKKHLKHLNYFLFFSILNCPFDINIKHMFYCKKKHYYGPLG